MELNYLKNDEIWKNHDFLLLVDSLDVIGTHCSPRLLIDKFLIFNMAFKHFLHQKIPSAIYTDVNKTPQSSEICHTTKSNNLNCFMYWSY